MADNIYSNESKLFAFFSELRGRRAAFAQSYAEFAPHLAPRFNTFDFLRPSEIQLSELLASFLSPLHHHAQGDLFLQLFLSRIRTEQPLDAVTRHKAAIVKCEVVTDRIANKSRRIDIEIDLGSFGVAIENKPWAGDQNNQLVDYGQQMQAKYGNGNWCLVYLTALGTEPSISSLPKATRDLWLETGQYVELSYGTVVQWLVECEAQCRSDHVRHFLRDFIAYCNSQFLGTNSSMNSDLVRKFALQQGNLELALMVAQEVTKIKEELFNQFVTDLRVALTSNFVGWQIHIPEKYSYWSTRDNPIKVFKTGWEKYRLAIEFAYNKANGFFWGVKKRTKEMPELPLVNTLANTFTERVGKASAWWPWYCDAETQYLNWESSTDVWLAIQDGTLVQKIIDNLMALRSAVESIIDVAEGVSMPTNVVTSVTPNS